MGNKFSAAFVGYQTQSDAGKLYNNHPTKDDIFKCLQAMLSQTIDDKIKDLYAFFKRMTKYKDYLFNFLHYPDVLADNNCSERAIRNVKVKQKYQVSSILSRAQ